MQVMTRRWHIVRHVACIVLLSQHSTTRQTQHAAATSSALSTRMLGCFHQRLSNRGINDVARIVSIDYGKRRTGIAVTDPLQIIANGLATVSTSQLYQFLVDYMAKEPVERIVIGKPVQPNGQPSENLARVEQFVARWKKSQPDIPIEYVDERYTSVLAHRAMIDGGLHKKARQDKALVDEISATIILQSYMEGRRSSKFKV